MPTSAIFVLLAGLAAAPQLWAQRDPFAAPPPPPAAVAAKPAPRPAGLAGLDLSQVQVLGVALGGPSGAVALLAGPGNQTFFVRAGAQLFDARVLRFDGNGVWFQPREGGTAVYKRVSG